MIYKSMFFLLAAAFAWQSSFAADSLRVNVPNVPLLNGRECNVLFAIDIVSDAENDVFSGVCLEFTDETDMSGIKSVALYKEGNDSVPLFVARHPRSRSLFLKAEDTLEYGKRSGYYALISLDDGASLTGIVGFSLVSVETGGGNIISEYLKGNTFRRRNAVAVRDSGCDGAAAYRIPGLVTTSEGTLVAVYDIRYESSADLQGKIKIGTSRSTDGGKTWKPMKVAVDFEGYGGLPSGQNGAGDPCILYDGKNDRLWIASLWCHGMPGKRAWMASGQGLSPEETGQLVLVSSDDDGITWSEPVNITPMVKDESWYLLLQGPGRGTVMEDGTLVFPAQFIDSTRTPNATIIYSEDAGKTWKTGSPARTKTTESQVVEYPRGALMLNMRDDRGGSRAVYVSRDKGKTWEEHPSSRSALREPVCMASLIAVKAEDNVTGKDLLIFSNPDSSSERKDITVKISLDGGLTWPKEHQILLDEGYGWGYSCLTMIDDATVGILYESSVANMTFQAIPLQDFFPME